MDNIEKNRGPLPAPDSPSGAIQERKLDNPNGAAQAAAQEVASATDLAAAPGIIEPAAQAEQIALDALETEELEAPTPTPDGRAAELTGHERKEVGRMVFRLAWPAIAENALQTLLGIVDTAVVARLGTAALSGVGASQQLMWLLSTALIAVAMGTTVLIARFIGAQDTHSANNALKQSLIVSAAVSLLIMPVALFARPILSMLGLTPAAVEEGTTYFGITIGFIIFMVLMFTAGAALRGAGDTKTPMYVTAMINVLNAILAVLLVFGGDQASRFFGEWLSGVASWLGADVTIQVPALSWIPAMGVAGAAIATVIARTVGSALLLSVFLRSRSPLQLWRRGGWLPNFTLIGRLLKVGIPTAVEQMLMSLGILVYTFLVIGMGEVIFATSRLVLNVIMLSILPGFGFSMAATTLVGQSLGAQRPQRAWLGTTLATRSALIFMSAMGVAFFFFSEPILRIFTDDPQMIAFGDPALKIVALSQPSQALAFVLSGALRGAGDVRYPMVVTTVAIWLIRLPVGAFLGLPSVCLPFTSLCVPALGLGLPGIYLAIIVEASIRAALFFVRYRAGKWETMKV